MNALLQRFLRLAETDLVAAGFVRRKLVFRLFGARGDAIVVDVQRATALWGEVEFYVNVGVLIAPYTRHLLGRRSPQRAAMPHHGVWDHRLTATDATAELPDHRFSLSTDADADRAAGIVRSWLAASLPRLTSWLGDYDAMLAALEEDRVRSERASAEQLATGRWTEGAWPDGGWAEQILTIYALADRGDVAGVRAATADWEDAGDPGSVAADALAHAQRRRVK